MKVPTLTEIPMLSLSDLIGGVEPISTVIPSKKITVQLTPVSYSTVLQLREAIGLRPTPPLVANPNKGSLAPLEQNENDPAYQEAISTWSRTLRISQLAVSMGYAINNVGFKDCSAAEARAKWVKQSCAELLEKLTDTDLVALGNVYDRVQGEGASDLPTSAG
jgi:hypothetical protein